MLVSFVINESKVDFFFTLRICLRIRYYWSVAFIVLNERRSFADEMETSSFSNCPVRNTAPSEHDVIHMTFLLDMRVRTSLAEFALDALGRDRLVWQRRSLRPVFIYPVL